jgi:hypothetical protein
MLFFLVLNYRYTTRELFFYRRIAAEATVEDSSVLLRRVAILRRDASCVIDPTARRLVMALAEAAERLAARMDEDEGWYDVRRQTDVDTGSLAPRKPPFRLASSQKHPGGARTDAHRHAGAETRSDRRSPR